MKTAYFRHIIISNEIGKCLSCTNLYVVFFFCFRLWSLPHNLIARFAFDKSRFYGSACTICCCCCCCYDLVIPYSFIIVVVIVCSLFRLLLFLNYAQFDNFAAAFGWRHTQTAFKRSKEKYHIFCLFRVWFCSPFRCDSLFRTLESFERQIISLLYSRISLKSQKKLPANGRKTYLCSLFFFFFFLFLYTTKQFLFRYSFAVSLRFMPSL